MTTARWYFARNGERVGPHTLPQLRELLEARHLLPVDMVWQEGTANWVAVGSVRELEAGPVEAGGGPGPPPPASVDGRPTRLAVCGVCGTRVADTAYACPSCGAPQPALEKVRDTVLALLAFLAGGCMPLLLFNSFSALFVHAESSLLRVLVSVCPAVACFLAAGKLVGFRALYRVLSGRR